MQFLLTPRFERAYAALSPEDRQQVAQALRLMSADLRHPGLRVKRVRGTKGIWEARASRALRITFETAGDSLILRNIGWHDEALRNP
jgi:mRNA interferase RelE/StbE